MAIGSLALTPTFDSEKTSYTVTTENASNTVTATSASETAVITVKVNGATFTNGNSATWNTGKNTVEATVTDKRTSRTYTVEVTKSE